MILRKLRVQHFRCFRNPVELSGLGLGVHVIHAPNETGKSSLILAVARALFDRYSTKDQEIQQLRPWKTDLSPRITLEFETAGKRFQLEKSFLKDAQSILNEWTGKHFERLAESQQADELVRQYLSSSVPGSGATKVGNWGLARLLWLNQTPERHQLPKLDVPLQARLMETVGIATLSDKEQSLLRAVDEAYRRFYTPKTAKPVAGGDLLQDEERVRVLEHEVARLHQRQAETAQHTLDIEDTHHELAPLAEEKKKYEQELTLLHARIDAETKLEQQLALRQKDVERQDQQRRNLDQKHRELVTLQRKVAQQEALVKQKEPALQEAQRTLGRVEEQLREASERLKAQQGALEKAELRLEQGRTLEGAREALEEQHRLEELVKKGTRLVNAVDAGLRKKGTGKALSESEVKRTEELQRKLEQAQVRMEAQGVELVFKADSAQSVEWEAQGRAAVPHKVSKGEQKLFAGVSAGELRIKGVGLLSVRTGAEEVGKLQAEIDKLRKDLARRIHEQGVEDVAGLRKAWEVQQAQVQQQQKHEEALSTFLETADVESLEALKEKQQEIAGDIGARAEQLGLDVKALTTYTFPDVSSLAEQQKTCKRELKSREKTRDEVGAAHKKVEVHLRAVTQECDDARTRAKTLGLELKSQLDALGMSLEQLGAKVEEASAEWERLESLRKGLEAKLPRPEERATTQRQRLQDALERVASTEKKAQEKIIRAEALINQAAAEGLYSQLCEAEEKLALAQEQYQRLQTRALAAQSLHTLARSWKDKVSRTFVAPIEKEVHTRLEYIRGAGRPEHLLLDPDFSEAQMETADGPKPLTTFSAGAQEQTLFALRLALGNLLSQGGPRPEPQLVVLDDALVNTDSARHRRALELIENAGDTLQILILTTFPERYRTLRGMKEFDLKAILQEPSRAS
jgi:DNA repair exonuclease SbcCD ATPase subunit